MEHKCRRVRDTDQWTREWWNSRSSLHEQNCTTSYTTAFDVEFRMTRLKMLSRKLKITGINWRVFTWWEEPNWIRCSSWWRFCETRERWNTWWNEQWQKKITQRVWIPTWAGWEETFWRYYNWCWRIDHKESQYWFEWEDAENNPTQDPLQRDIREWSSSSKKG